jgi:hypothetical protein
MCAFTSQGLWCLSPGISHQSSHFRVSRWQTQVLDTPIQKLAGRQSSLRFGLRMIEACRISGTALCGSTRWTVSPRPRLCFSQALTAKMTRRPSILFFNKIMSCFWRVDLDEPPNFWLRLGISTRRCPFPAGWFNKGVNTMKEPRNGLPNGLPNQLLIFSHKGQFLISRFTHPNIHRLRLLARNPSMGWWSHSNWAAGAVLKLNSPCWLKTKANSPEKKRLVQGF